MTGYSEKEVFGIVHKGTYRGIDVAVKEIVVTGKMKKNKEVLRKAQTQFEEEIKIISQLRHPNILGLYGITDNLGIVTEYCPNGDLYTMLHDGRVFKLDELLGVVKGIMLGLSYLHSKHIIHGDIKSDNILMSAGDIPKISDFGLSKTKQSTSEVTSEKRGTICYMAPEALRGEPYNSKADVYSFALVVWEMLTNERPYEGWILPKLVARVGMKAERPDMPERTPPELAQLIEACWEQDARRGGG
eukprot:TRINITY_DN14327_c0_g1_i1.p1 TRINITY_DN14327_c0_g1~~TRINITY_DN14327_c0_g1_i1.p1  ORF type:complete len:245 (-),score=36.27 TRINITY_DN14327_c0_g1_i1:242-976(-)